MEFLNFFLITSILSAQCFAAPPKSKKPELNPRLGHNQEKIRTIFSSILPSHYGYSSPGAGYNAHFRPRGENETSNGNTPTIMRINLKSLKLSALSDTHLDVVGTLGVEYLDSRLAYEAPDGIKFIEASEARAQLWLPRLRIGGKYLNIGQRDRYNGGDNDHFEENPRAWISPEGLVRQDLAFERELTGRQVSSNRTEFEMKIQDDKDFVEDVRLEWTLDKAVTLAGEPVKSIQGAKYNATVTKDKCELIEDFGSFGQQEFGCLRTTFVLLKTGDKISTRFKRP